MAPVLGQSLRPSDVLSVRGGDGSVVDAADNEFFGPREGGMI